MYRRWMQRSLVRTGTHPLPYRIELIMHATLPLIEETGFPALRRRGLTTLQVNLGYRCNQTCVHCHVNAGPTRTEMMDAGVLALVPRVLAKRGLETLDLTGGAPELHEGFRQLVREARSLEIKVIDRCNLTILFEPGQNDLAGFLAGQQVEVVASLPCYSRENVDKQRGDGVFDKSIAALQILNNLGYGKEGTNLVLHLIYNPLGAFLPPGQKPLEAAYKKELKELFGIEFTNLYTLTNMPIKRFLFDLQRRGKLEEYMDILVQNFNPHAAQRVMCRNIIS